LPQKPFVGNSGVGDFWQPANYRPRTRLRAN
jgi:hypothetical protein